MSFVTWLVLPVAITLVVSLIMLFMSRRPRTNTHQDIESFARFRGALARPMAAPPDVASAEPVAPSAPVGAPEPAEEHGAITEGRQHRVRTNVAVSPKR